MKRPLVNFNFILQLLLLTLGLSGCWTFNETPYPTAPLVQAPKGSSIAVGLSGFEATMTTTVSIHGYSTVWVPGYYGRHHYHGGYYQTIPSTSFVEQQYQTDAYLKRARTALEDAGFIVGATTPQWALEVEFSGPYTEASDAGWEALWMFGSVFLCDYTAVNWHATLRLRDNRTGRLALHREYDQRYETHVFSLIPLLGISSCDKSNRSYMQCWCLGALVDRALMDATDYMTKNK